MFRLLILGLAVAMVIGVPVSVGRQRIRDRQKMPELQKSLAQQKSPFRQKVPSSRNMKYDFRSYMKTRQEEEIISTEGAVLTSPGFEQGANYDNYLDIHWLITPPTEGQVASVDIEYFDLEYHPSCLWDEVTFYSGDSEVDAAEITTMCGYRPPQTIYSEGQDLYITFHSDYSVTAAGFMMTVHFVDPTEVVAMPDTSCNGYEEITLTADLTQGSIYSPSYPLHDYPDDLECVWVLTAPSGQNLRLDFVFFDVENEPNCEYDSLTVTIDTVDYTYCGRDLPNPMMSETGSLTITFLTDYSVGLAGFQIDYHATNEDASNLPVVTDPCPGPVQLTATAEVGEIYSPGYGDGIYGNDRRCQWLIEAPEDMVVYIVIEEMEIEYQAWCWYDSLRFYDGSTAAEGEDITLCGSVDDYDENEGYSSGRNVLIRFLTDYSVDDGYFKILYSASVPPADSAEDLAEEFDSGTTSYY